MRKAFSRTLAVAAAAALALSASACSSPGADDSGGGDTGGKTETIRLGWVPALGWGAFGALSLQEYDGFKVELLNFSSSTDIMTAMVRDQIDVGIVSNTAVAGGLDQGTEIPLTGIAGSSVRAGALLVGNDSGIEVWDDVAGKQVGLIGGSEESYQFQAAATAHGLEGGKDYEIVNFQAGTDELLALQRGDIDMTVTYEPLASQGVVGGYATRASDAITDGFYEATFEISSSVFVADTFIGEHEDELVQLLEKYIEIVNAYDADRQVAADDYLQLQPGEEETIREAVNNTFPNYGINQADLEFAISALHQYGVTKEDQTAAVVALIDYELLSKASGESPEELGKTG